MNILINGASGGIGQALAREAQTRWPEAQLALAAREPGRIAEDLASELLTLRLDLSDESSISEAAATVKDRLGTLQLLINAGGLLHDGELQPEKRLEDFDGEQAARLFAVNSIGPMRVARHFWPLLKHDERAVFASIAARVGSIEDNRLGGWYSYRASKAALVMYNRSLAIEMKRRARQLICVCLHPGTVDTPLSSPFQANVPEEQLFSPERAAAQLLDVVEGLGTDDSGGHFAWDGQAIPG